MIRLNLGKCLFIYLFFSYFFFCSGVGALKQLFYLYFSVNSPYGVTLISGVDFEAI